MGYIVVAMFLIVYSTIFYATAIASGSVDLSSTYYWTAVYGLPFIGSGVLVIFLLTDKQLFLKLISFHVNPLSSPFLSPQ